MDLSGPHPLALSACGVSGGSKRMHGHGSIGPSSVGSFGLWGFGGVKTNARPWIYRALIRWLFRLVGFRGVQNECTAMDLSGPHPLALSACGVSGGSKRMHGHGS